MSSLKKANLTPWPPLAEERVGDRPCCPRAAGIPVADSPTTFIGIFCWGGKASKQWVWSKIPLGAIPKK